MLIDVVKQRIVEKFNPELLLLFGSRSRGDARDDSDIDLLLVMDTGDTKPIHRALPIRKVLSDIPVSKDILVYTPHEFQSWLTASASLPARAMAEGLTLYRRQP